MCVCVAYELYRCGCIIGLRDLVGFEGVRKTEVGTSLWAVLRRLLLRLEGPLVGVCSMVGRRYRVGSLGSLCSTCTAECLWTEDDTLKALEGGISSGSAAALMVVSGRRGKPLKTSFRRLPFGVAVT